MAVAWTLGLSRVFSLVVAVVVGGGLAVAAWLSPAAAGHGTHQQLGLASCSILTWTGYPCPMCGMTTTFAAMMNGDVAFALWNQPFGAALFVGSCLALGVALAELIQPKDRWARLWQAVAPWEGWLALAFLAGLAGSWIWKLMIFDYGSM